MKVNFFCQEDARMVKVVQYLILRFPQLVKYCIGHVKQWGKILLYLEGILYAQIPFPRGISHQQWVRFISGKFFSLAKIFQKNETKSEVIFRGFNHQKIKENWENLAYHYIWFQKVAKNIKW